MSFKPVNELESILIKASTDVSLRPKFYEVLYKSEVFILSETKINDRDGKYIAQEGDAISIHTITYEGENYLTVFTSLNRLSNYMHKKLNYIKIKFHDLINITQGVQIIINPGSNYLALGRFD